MLFYCLHCHERPNPVKETQKVINTKNNQYRISEVCIKCQKRKSSFISKATIEIFGSPNIVLYSEFVGKPHKKKSE